jgi:hypothetical protein
MRLEQPKFLDEHAHTAQSPQGEPYLQAKPTRIRPRHTSQQTGPRPRWEATACPAGEPPRSKERTTPVGAIAIMRRGAHRARSA